MFTFGSPILGWMLGHMAINCLTRVYNEPIVEIMITLSVAYSAYILAEDFFKVSGVLTLVTLGIVMAAHKESITPEVEELVHRFWEILAYLTNTIIFFLVGMVIIIKAAGSVERNDIFLITATYIGVNVFRYSVLFFSIQTTISLVK
ncbi:SLC9C1 [Cordylochernes scorpioides]|uniref:SLC9C1 n=1 Tax=Cordylochernes scorpioides TaxID=51811 RepID=A0ABY6LS51_9ARAC|nr:SLC9C1 [Cordylochernes scorpioides]